MDVHEIELQGRTRFSSDSSIFSAFPIVSFPLEDGVRDNLLFYVFQLNGNVNYVILGKMRDGYLPKLENQEFLEWLEQLSKLLAYDVLNSTKALEADYLSTMAKVQQSNLIHQIEWTQEGFDLLSGKQNFLPKGIIQRTVGTEIVKQDGGFLFGNQYFSVNEKNNMKNRTLFAPFCDYVNNYFLNAKDCIKMSYDQVRAFSLFHRYRIVKYVRGNQNFNSWAQPFCKEALIPDLESSNDAAMQLLNGIVEFQLGAKLLDKEKKTLF